VRKRGGGKGRGNLQHQKGDEVFSRSERAPGGKGGESDQKRKGKGKENHVLQRTRRGSLREKHRALLKSRGRVEQTELSLSRKEADQRGRKLRRGRGEKKRT